MHIIKSTLGVAGAVSLVSWTGSLAAQPVAEWTFDRAGDLQGWQPNSHLTNVVVTNGVLVCRAVGSDPILELRPLLDLKASPWQVVEIRLQADRDGTAELFWSNTSTGRYGGFTQEKTTRFNVTGDGQWHTYRLLPCWHPEGRIVRLRFDVYDGARFELDSIREVFTAAPRSHDDVTPADAGLGPYDVPPPEPARTAWEFEHTDEGWNNMMQMADLKAVDGALTARTVGNDPAIFSPPVAARAGEFGTVVIRLRLSRTDGKSFNDSAQLFWRTRRLPESESSSLRFPVPGDGQWHEYHIAASQNMRWRGVITKLRLDPCNQPDVVVSLDSVRLEK